MSGRTQTNPFQTEIPVPDDAEGLTRSLPEILRQVLNKIALLENDIATIQPGRMDGMTQQMGGMAQQMASLQAAQTTVQQSLNLLQSAHNSCTRT